MPRRSVPGSFASKAVLLGLSLAACGQAQEGQEGQGDAPSVVVPEGAVRGTLRMRIANYGDHSETFYRLVTKDETVELDFAGRPPAALPGSDVAVRGVRDGRKLRVDVLDVLRAEGEGEGEDNSAALASPPTDRVLKIAFISLDQSYSPTKGKQRLLQATDGAAAFYRENSYGKWTMEGDAFGPFTVSIPTCSNDELDKIAERGIAAAKGAGMQPEKYDNFMFYMPASAGCSWGGIAEVGVNPVRGFKNGKNTWYRSDNCVVFVQELGHNFGLLHSHKCSGTPYASNAFGGQSCPGFSEYGDPYSPMGSGCGHFNAPELGAMKFVSGCNTVAVESSGMFEIGPVEKQCAGPQILRVPGAAKVNQGPQFIYAEYRLGRGTLGSDTKSPPGVYLYASAEYGGNMTDVSNPDNRWAVDPFVIHAPMTANQQWAEPSSGVTFKVVSTGATATVQLTFANAGGGAPKCVDGSAAPASPMCGIVGGTGGAGGRSGTGGAGAGGMGGGASGTGGVGGRGNGGNPGSGGASGTGGRSGTGGVGSGGSGNGTGGNASTGGSSATGGSVGTGGADVTGGGGSPGSGGASSGGSTGSTGGRTGTGGRGTGNTGGGDGGCGCSVPGNGAGSALSTLALAAAFGGLARGRRRRRQR